MGETEKITTEDSFRIKKNTVIGYMVITDGNKKKLHNITCPDVDFYYFRTKVIDNKEKNGSYYWSTLIENLKLELGNLDDCLHCKHLY